MQVAKSKRESGILHFRSRRPASPVASSKVARSRCRSLRGHRAIDQQNRAISIDGSGADPSPRMGPPRKGAPTAQAALRVDAPSDLPTSSPSKWRRMGESRVCGLIKAGDVRSHTDSAALRLRPHLPARAISRTAPSCPSSRLLPYSPNDEPVHLPQWVPPPPARCRGAAPRRAPRATRLKPRRRARRHLRTRRRGSLGSHQALVGANRPSRVQHRASPRR